jgi:hypothetical protein
MARTFDGAYSSCFKLHVSNEKIKILRFPVHITSETTTFAFLSTNLVTFYPMKKVQPDDEIIKIDEELGIVWIRLPPDKALGGFRGISPRIIDEEKFLSAKKRRGNRGNR